MVGGARGVWSMEPGSSTWELLEGSLFQPAQSELKTSGLLQQGLWRDSSQGYMLQDLGAGLREAGGYLSRSVDQGPHSMGLRAPGYCSLSDPITALYTPSNVPCLWEIVTCMVYESHLSSGVSYIPAPPSSAEPNNIKGRMTALPPQTSLRKTAKTSKDP